MTIYLYVKQHSVTGLKYFGKTIRKNPKQYLGSGTFWCRHIRKHGTQFVKTTELYEFQNQEEATKFALEFSEKNNIVESLEWANLMVENARDGSHEISENTKKKISIAHTGRKHSETTKEKHRQAMFGNKHLVGFKHSSAAKQKISRSLAGRQPWNSGKSGYSKPLSEAGKEALRRTHKGKILSPETRKKISMANQGKTAHNKNISPTKVVSRISDRKEFSKSHWNQWMSKSELEYIDW